MNRLIYFALFALGLALALSCAWAQDMRNVAEPIIPPACATLVADLSSSGSTLVEADESRPDTQRIQQAIDHCAPGQSVRLQARGALNAFLSGPLQLRTGVALLVDSHTILFGSREPRDYDVSPGSCGILDHQGHGCRALINGDHTNNAAVMGDGTIDGRGWAKMLGQKKSWWDIAQEAKTAGSDQNCPRLIVMTYSDNFTLYRVTLKNAANFHVYFSNGNGFTAWGVTINTPKNARNTDGIDPSSATNVTIAHCFIHTGDDDVAIKASSAGSSSHMTISHNHFYTGHGMSIGSETQGGVSAIRINDLSIDGADNGLRIKSNSERGGLVQDVVYEDVCIRDTKNPILMDSHYPFSGKARDMPPRFRSIVLQDVRVLGPGKITLEGYDAEHRLEITLNNVVLDAPAETKFQIVHAVVALGPGPVSFMPSGEDVQVTGHLGKARPNSCNDKFESLPVK
jgi:polygalacturonase